LAVRGGKTKQLPSLVVVITGKSLILKKCNELW
jgi:hypothetical protein